MVGFSPSSAVVVIAAPNRPDVLDAALMRPGRFDRQIHIDPPDRDGRLEILHVHAKDKPIPDELLPHLASQTPGFTGAELANLLNEAAIIAARRDAEEINAKDLDSALMRVVAGLESKRLLTDEERDRIAYHEVGHALCAHFTTHRTPVHKISTVSRGRALGFTLSVPEQDRLLETKDSLMDRLCMLLGGRAAELHVFGSASSGASNDLERATELATQMITQMGMSDKIGLRTIPAEGHGFQPGSVMPGTLHCSPATAQLVEAEVAELIEQAQDQALNLISKHDQDLENVTRSLMEHETLHADQFLDLLGEEPETA
jgi:cell division protease FtsH